MNAIVGFTSLAITHIDRKEHVEEYLKKIQTSGNHLLSLINDVLDMSRIESGKTKVNHESFDIRTCINNCASIIGAFIVTNGSPGNTTVPSGIAHISPLNLKSFK